jgi:hypothetical protein
MKTYQTLHENWLEWADTAQQDRGEAIKALEKLSEDLFQLMGLQTEYLNWKYFAAVVSKDDDERIDGINALDVNAAIQMVDATATKLKTDLEALLRAANTIPLPLNAGRGEVRRIPDDDAQADSR